MFLPRGSELTHPAGPGLLGGSRTEPSPGCASLSASLARQPPLRTLSSVRGDIPASRCSWLFIHFIQFLAQGTVEV